MDAIDDARLDYGDTTRPKWDEGYHPSMNKNVGGPDRIARTVLAIVLTVVAVSAFRSGERSKGLLAATGALGLGFNATTCFCGLNRVLGIDTTGE